MKIDIINLLKNDQLLIGDSDIINSCKTDELKEIYGAQFREGEHSNNAFKIKFLKENIEGIDVERLFLLGMHNKSFLIDAFIERIKQDEENLKRLRNSISSDKWGEYEQLYQECIARKSSLELEKKNFEYLKTIAKKIDVIFARSIFADDDEYLSLKNDNNSKPAILILDSKVESGEKTLNNKAKSKKFTTFFDNLKKIQGEDIDGFTTFFLLVPYSEMVGIFPTSEFNYTMYDYCLNKFLWEEGIKSKEEIIKIRSDGPKFFKEYLKDGKEEFVEKVMYPEIEKNIVYADIDQLIMRGACRIQMHLESENYTQAELDVIKKVLEEVKRYSSKLPSNYEVKLIAEGGSFNPVRIGKYAQEDIEMGLKKFCNGRYIKQKELEGYKKMIENGQIYLSQFVSQFSGELLGVMYEDGEDFKRLMFLNDRNFQDTLELVKLGKEQIISIAEEQGINSEKILGILERNNVIDMHEVVDMHLEGKVEQNIVLKMSEDKEIEELIDFEKLINLYKQKVDDSKAEEKYVKFIKYSKAILEQVPEEKMEEKRKEFSEKFMEYFADNYNPDKREEYINQLENFYKEGLIDIESVINWEDEAIVARFLKDRVIDSTIVKKLMTEKTISVQYAQSLFGECILDSEMDNETRIKLIKSGLISADYIGKAYQLSLIKSSLADELTEAGYFEKSKYDNISILDLQENAKIKLGDLRSLTKIRTDFSEKPGKSPKRDYEKSKDKGILIDPNAREDLFELLKARKAESLEIQPDDPFYNYEFYILPDENKEYGPNSVVIAERYYTNKDTMKTFATQNATYFFKWRDLLYISNLKKSEIAKESKDIVFRAHHVVSDGTDKAGSWGGSVLTSIGKTMMGREVRKYGKKSLKTKALEKLKSMYSEEEWEKINNHAIDIDVGDYSFKNLASSYSSDDDDPHSDGLR